MAHCYLCNSASESAGKPLIDKSKHVPLREVALYHTQSLYNALVANGTKCVANKEETGQKLPQCIASKRQCNSDSRNFFTDRQTSYAVISFYCKCFRLLFAEILHHILSSKRQPP